MKKHLTEPIISKEKDPLIFFPLVFLATWIGTAVYRRSGISYFEYLLWMVPVAIIAFALYFLLIVWLKKRRAKDKE
ncbi:SoxR reducing system RseC family protein [Planococcus maitriensis]|nr:SoxR reducing system RseC family protein [Planococcus maitriensis]